MESIGSYAVRISLPVDKLEPLWIAWGLLCDSITVYQHDEASRVHVHCYIENIKSTMPTFKSRISTIATELKGQQLWAWKKCNTIADRNKYITYCSKGTIEPSICTHTEHKLFLKLASNWVSHNYDVTKVSPSLFGYLEFEKHVLEKPIDDRVRTGDIQVYARSWAFHKHGWFSQVANNEAKNYATTYSYKYKTLA